MAETRSLQTSSSAVDITRRVKEGHERILGLLQQYLASPVDSRQALVEHILNELASQLEMEEHVVFEKLRRSGPEGQQRIRAPEVEREEIKTIILELQHVEGDDGQAMDEVFEDLMQSVRGLFVAEERDLLPFIDRSGDV
jgi:hypothetical protein